MDAMAIERQQRVRELFFQRGDGLIELLPQGVDPALLRGWQRCRDGGLEPERPVVFRSVLQSRVRAGRESSHLLRTVAERELAQLGRALAPSGAAVVLTDPHLMILDVLGRGDRMSRELRSLAREGVDLSERVVGSSALSLAAHERAPSIVLNNGHFFTANSVFACAAAPLLSPTGALIGVLDVTVCRAALPAQALFLVSTAAKAIENAMCWQDPALLVIRFHPREDFVDTALGAILACSVDGEIVGANQVALSMLGLGWPLAGARFERCFRQKIGDLLGRAGRLDRFALDLTVRGGAAVFARVRMPGRIAGCGAHPAGPGASAFEVDVASRRPEPDPEPESAPDEGSVDRSGSGNLRQLEQRMIEQALSRHRGNVSSAARELGVSRGTLYRRIRPNG
ncbi:MAG: helix-turn-helix domain-containing protein [Burkholderiaceae bacterium]